MNIEDRINTIIAGNCADVFKSIPDNSVDMVFADPPFNLSKKYGNYKDRIDNEEYIKWCEIWLKEIVRVTKQSGSIFIHNIPKWLIRYSEILNKSSEFKHWISWGAPSGPMGKSLQPSHYGILYYAKSKQYNKFYEIRHPHKRCRRCKYLIKDYGGKKNIIYPFGPLVSDVWTDIYRTMHTRYRNDHPCQLPVHLLERLILMCTDENDIVLDPFVGVGTSAIAAKKLGRRYIGFDIDPKYVEIAINRVNSELQTKIGNIFVSKFLNRIITIRCKDWDDLMKYFDVPLNPRDVDKTETVLLR